MAIEKKLNIRRVGGVYSYQGFVREESEDPSKENSWKEATPVITQEDVRWSAPESEVREYCIKQVDLYLLKDKTYPVTEEEEYL